MSTKRYEFQFGQRLFRVWAEVEGEARYMVRMAEINRPGGFAQRTVSLSALKPEAADVFSAYVRIGYLTGAKRHWLVEHGAGHALLTTPATTAKEACFALARWALTQPAFVATGPVKKEPTGQRYAHIH